MPPSKQVTLARRTEAFLLLGVKPEEVVATPKISPLLKKLKGGWAQALIYLRYSESPIARRFLARYDNILFPEWTRRVVPIEAFCLSAKVSPVDLWDTIVEAYRRVNQQLASMATADSHPDIVANVIQRSRGGDEKATTHLLKHMQFLPQAKGAQVSVTTNVQATAQAAATLPAPPPEETIRRMANRFNAEKPPQTLEGSTLRDDRALPPSVAEPLSAMTPRREPTYVERSED